MAKSKKKAGGKRRSSSASSSSVTPKQAEKMARSSANEAAAKARGKAEDARSAGRYVDAGVSAAAGAGINAVEKKYELTNIKDSGVSLKMGMGVVGAVVGTGMAHLTKGKTAKRAGELVQSAAFGMLTVEAAERAGAAATKSNLPEDVGYMPARPQIGASNGRYAYDHDHYGQTTEAELEEVELDS